MKDEPKYVGYTQEFRPLGVLLNLSDADVVIRNLPDRLRSICELCDEFLQDVSWMRAKLDRLLGRCNFARAYVPERSLNIPMSILYVCMAGANFPFRPCQDDQNTVQMIKLFAASRRSKNHCLGSCTH